MNLKLFVQISFFLFLTVHDLIQAAVSSRKLICVESLVSASWYFVRPRGGMIIKNDDITSYKKMGSIF